MKNLEHFVYGALAVGVLGAGYVLAVRSNPVIGTLTMSSSLVFANISDKKYVDPQTTRDQYKPVR